MVQDQNRRPSLGLSSYAYRWAFGFGEFRPTRTMTAEDLLARTASLGLEAVQICDNVPFTEYSEERLDSLREQASRLGIRIETGARGVDHGVLERALAASVRLGADLLRVVVEIERESRRSALKQLDRIAESLRRAADLGRRCSVSLAIENHATVTSAELVHLIRSVESDFCGACLDTMNSVLLLERPEETVETLAPYALSIHLKDFRVVKHPDLYRIEGVALGDGLLDLQSIVATVGRHRRVRSYHAELYIEGGQDETRTLVREEECVRRSAAELRRLFS